MRIAVDFDGTLACGNKSHISTLIPNRALILRLQELRASINPEILIVTARGGKAGLSDEEKRIRYYSLIASWLEKYGVPYDKISFKKEYANLYIDDMTITQRADFEGQQSKFTGNKIVFTDDTVIKVSKSALFEFEWYKEAKMRGFSTPGVLFCNDECIITERILFHEKPKAIDFIRILEQFKRDVGVIGGMDFSTYLMNVPLIEGISDVARSLIPRETNRHLPTFFHGDLSTTNVLKTKHNIWLIDPNSKYIFGSYLTDAGKAVFSLIAYENDFSGAQEIVDHFGQKVWPFAIAEGLRVCKYRPEYVDIVNNIADAATAPVWTQTKTA